MREDLMDVGVQRARWTRRLGPEGGARADVTPIFDPSAQLQPMVMVIDDSRAVRRVVEISLSRQGISTISFADGVEAMGALYRGEIAPPKVLLIDVGMPRMNGYEVARRLKSNHSFDKCHLIMLTGHDGVLNRVLAAMLGAGFIAKPFKSLDLVRIVCGLLGVSGPDER